MSKTHIKLKNIIKSFKLEVKKTVDLQKLYHAIVVLYEHLHRLFSYIDYYTKTGDFYCQFNCIVL